MHRSALWLVLAGAPWLCGQAAAGPHPFSDDGGTVNWQLIYPAALDAAQRTGKPLFVEATYRTTGGGKHMLGDIYQDSKIRQLLNRHFVAVVVDYQRPPADLKAMFGRIEGNGMPIVMVLDGRGQFVNGHRRPSRDELVADLEQALGLRTMAVPVAKEAELNKHLEKLQAELEAKNYKKAVAEFKAVATVRGYSLLKDKAHDLMDGAQAEGLKKLDDALAHARKKEFAEARKLLEAAAKDFPDLPIADEAKQHLAAVKVLDTAYQQSAAVKGPAWKAATVQYLDQLLQQYPNTPYANLALRRKTEIMKN